MWSRQTNAGKQSTLVGTSWKVKCETVCNILCITMRASVKLTIWLHCFLIVYQMLDGRLWLMWYVDLHGTSHWRWDRSLHYTVYTALHRYYNLRWCQLFLSSAVIPHLSYGCRPLLFAAQISSFNCFEAVVPIVAIIVFICDGWRP